MNYILIVIKASKLLSLIEYTEDEKDIAVEMYIRKKAALPSEYDVLLFTETELIKKLKT